MGDKSQEWKPPEDEPERHDENKKIMILVYNTESGRTTRSFIEALKKQLYADFEFKFFKDANEDEKTTLSVIAVVRHTSTRVAEILNEVKEQFDKDKIKDLGRVFVTYFYVNRSDRSCLRTIEQISESGQFKFAKIVPINFIDTSLYVIAFLGCYLKPDNKESLQELKRCILSKMKGLVNIYVDLDSPLVKEFIAKLRQKLPSSIYLQDAKPLEKLTNETSPTLICTTGDVQHCQEKLKEKDLKNVFLVHIIDVGKRSEIRVMHDGPDDMENKSVLHDEQNPSSTLPVGAGNNTAQNDENMPCEMYKVLYYDGKFKIDFDLIKLFETFVADGLIK